MRHSKLIQFIKELLCAAVITLAMLQALGCISMSEQTAYHVITGVSNE